MNIKQNFMLNKIVLAFAGLFLFQRVVLAQAKEMKNFNLTWTAQSKNASESMPCGGGDIGLNVWVEKGELFIYMARSGNFDENNALLKTGRLRVTITPNIFEGKNFQQQLVLNHGYVTVSGKKDGVTATVKIWVDVYKPVINIDVNSSKKVMVTAAYESWRYKDRILQPRENFANSWKWKAPNNNIGKKDEINVVGNSVYFYHHNKSPNIFDTTVSAEGMDAVKDSLYNPLKDLCFGGVFSGRNFKQGGIYNGIYANTDFKGWQLKSVKPSTQQSLQLCLWNAQVAEIESWKKSLDSIQNISQKTDEDFAKTQNWWQQFWDRSFIFINSYDTTSVAWQAGRNYQLFRYMLGCNAHGTWPTKFNGGLFTVDPVYTDTAAKLTPDFRNWGGGLHTAQNQRLVYFPTIKNGDWDVLDAQLEFYLRIQKNAELRSKVYWNHCGACFTEQMENYGLPDIAEYENGKRPSGFDKGVEYNAWLEYLWDTDLEFCLMMLEEQTYTGKDISKYIPFIESCLQFFDEHYQYLARKRGAKTFDGNGKLILFPGSGAETFKMAYNSSSTIAALQTITKRLLEVPQVKTNREKFLKWTNFLNTIPPISYRSFDGHVTVSPAQLWERVNNVESPQLYPVFPWGIFGIGKPGLDTAINTWEYDTSVIKFRSHVGWKQDNIFAARLGFTDDAWKLTSMKLQNSSRRFPAFWGPGFDWMPDHNWGGSAMIGLQEMLLQTDEKTILLFPSWPKSKDVHFKLNAPYNTVVEAELKNGKIMFLSVLPEERRKDIIMMLK